MLKSLPCAALLGACFMTYADDNAPKNIQLSNSQQTVEVSLPANATTGYQWFVQSYNHDLLNLQNYRYSKSSSNAIGSGGTATFSFSVDPRFYDAPQTTSVTFLYQQPWNAGKNTTETTVTISSTATNNDSLDWQKYPSTDEATPSTPDMNPSQAENADPKTNWLSLPSAMTTTNT